MKKIIPLQELSPSEADLASKNQAKEKCIDDLASANREIAIRKKENESITADLIVADEKLNVYYQENEKNDNSLLNVHKALIIQQKETEMRALELLHANTELTFQNAAQEKYVADLRIMSNQLALQNVEKEKCISDLQIKNKELAFLHTEQVKRTEELFLVNKELQKAKELIAELNIDLEQTIAERTLQLETANKDLEAFSYSISHDLRAPLRIINGFIQILAENHPETHDETDTRAIERILRGSKKMSDLIDSLLEFSRIGMEHVSKSQVSMNILISSIIAQLQEENPEREIKIIVHDLEDIKADINLLKQVFINLISNAFKFTGKISEAVIEVGCYQEKNKCVYFVKDNGSGFNMDYYDKLFGVFQRLHSQKEFEGTGVGLAIAHRIVTKHGGKLWAESKVDEGATFYVSLPV
ncbi:MAG: ATP-binding protein [Bacteroidota bacterium]